MTQGFRKTDPFTSKEAYESLDVNKTENLVMEALHKLGGKGTTENISEQSGLSLQTVTPRIKPLEMKGFVYRNGDVRPSKAGKNRLVVYLVPNKFEERKVKK